MNPRRILTTAAAWVFLGPIRGPLALGCWQMRQAVWACPMLLNGPLPDAARLRERFPPLTPYLGDDGNVCLRSAD